MSKASRLPDVEQTSVTRRGGEPDGPWRCLPAVLSRDRSREESTRISMDGNPLTVGQLSCSDRHLYVKVMGRLFNHGTGGHSRSNPASRRIGLWLRRSNRTTIPRSPMVTKPAVATNLRNNRFGAERSNPFS